MIYQGWRRPRGDNKMQKTTSNISLPTYTATYNAEQQVLTRLDQLRKVKATLDEEERLLQKEANMLRTIVEYMQDTGAYADEIEALRQQQIRNQQLAELDDEVEAQHDAGKTPQKILKQIDDRKKLTANPITGHLTVKEVEEIFRARAAKIGLTTF